MRDCLADVHENVRPGLLAFPAQRRLTRPHEARQVFVSLWQTQRRAHTRSLPPILPSSPALFNDYHHSSSGNGERCRSQLGFQRGRRDVVELDRVQVHV